MTKRTLIRIFGALHGLSLIIGETIRSWGQGRNPLFVVDDYLIGGFVLAAALLFTQDTRARRAAMAGGWAACAGMLYGSFFGKLFPDKEGQSFMTNIDPGVLTWLIGTAFIVSLIGLFATITLRDE
jgi:hypothetical protein